MEPDTASIYNVKTSGDLSPRRKVDRVNSIFTSMIYMVPGAGLEPARPQWPGDFKFP